MQRRLSFNASKDPFEESLLIESRQEKKRQNLQKVSVLISSQCKKQLQTLDIYFLCEK